MDIGMVGCGGITGIQINEWRDVGISVPIGAEVAVTALKSGYNVVVEKLDTIKISNLKKTGNCMLNQTKRMNAKWVVQYQK